MSTPSNPVAGSAALLPGGPIIEAEAQAAAALAAAVAANSVHRVADNAAKLALTGIEPGYTVVIAGEGGRIERFVPVYPVISVTVSGLTGEAAAFNGRILRVQPDVNGRAGYLDVNGVVELLWDGAQWTMVAYDSSLDNNRTIAVCAQDVPTPDLCTAWDSTGGSYGEQHPVLTPAPAASGDVNWLVLRNTVGLTILNLRPSGDGNVAGIACPAQQATYIGWVYEDAIPFDGFLFDTYIGQVFFNNETTQTNLTCFIDGSGLGGTMVLALPVPASPRAVVTVTLFAD